MAVFGLRKGVVNAGTVGQNDFFYEIRWLVKSILALEPKLHVDFSQKGPIFLTFETSS